MFHTLIHFYCYLKMFRSVKQQLPQFIEEYLVYCDCFIDINKQKTCWVLTRNLKFFEFYQKELVSTIDLQTTCLSKLKNNFNNYKGSKGKCYEGPGIHSSEEIAQSPISLGKYVYCVLNIYKIYVIIHCWDKCVILQRLPEFKGFEIKAEYEDLVSYGIIHGTVKYCPVLELKFQSNEVIKTDFQDKLDTNAEEDYVRKRRDISHLFERIRCAKTELELHKSITAKSFSSVQSNLTLGQPFLRTFKLEEKQILNRCGDIWKRLTAHDDLVIGVPLVNQCSAPNLSIIRNITPVLHSKDSPESSIQLHYRLFQLKLKFDQLDDLETFLECEDHQIQEKIWCANGDLQLLPESFAVLLIKLKIPQTICLKESSIILNYEVIRNLYSASDTLNTTFTMPLQLFLQNFNFDKLFFEERAQCELKFLPLTLHQDFLAIAMTSTEINLDIVFKSCKDLDIFEQNIQANLDFLKLPLLTNCNPDAGFFKSVFYNKNPTSLWFSSLILRIKEIADDDNNRCRTTWKIYCQNVDKTLLLVKAFLHDHLKLECNIVSISHSDNGNKNSRSFPKLKNALYQELLQVQEVLRDWKNEGNSKKHLKNLEKLCQLQFNSDVVASDVMEK